MHISEPSDGLLEPFRGAFEPPFLPWTPVCIKLSHQNPNQEKSLLPDSRQNSSYLIPDNIPAARL